MIQITVVVEKEKTAERTHIAYVCDKLELRRNLTVLNNKAGMRNNHKTQEKTRVSIGKMITLVLHFSYHKNVIFQELGVAHLDITSIVAGLLLSNVVCCQIEL